MSDPRYSFLRTVTEADDSLVRAKLASTITVSASAQVAGLFPAQVVLFQLVTLLSRLFDHVEVDIEGRQSVHRRLSILLPNGDLGAALTRVGQAVRDPSHVPTARGGGLRVLVGNEWRDSTDTALYVGNSGWAARISIVRPQEVVDSTNPVGALAAGALGAAEVFKLVFRELLLASVPLDTNGVPGYSLSLLDYARRPADADLFSEPQLPDRIAAEVALIGCGSLGSATLLGLLLLPGLEGDACVVDNGAFDTRNPAKYTLLDWETAREGTLKAVWAQRLLAAHHGYALRPRCYVGTATEYVASLPADYRIPLAVSAVDSRDARVDIQDMIPRRIVNGGVSGTTAEVSVHGFADDHACLACLTVGQHRESWTAHAIAERIGLNEARVYELIRSNGVLNKADVAEMVRSAKAPAAVLETAETFLGQPVLSFYNRALYAETTVQMSTGAEATVTTAFVSAFGGMLILSEVLKELLPDLRDFRLVNSYRQDLLGIPADDRMSYPRDGSGWCLCHSNFRQRVYREKYG